MGHQKMPLERRFLINVIGSGGTCGCFYFAATSKKTQPNKAKIIMAQVDGSGTAPVKGCMPSRRTCGRSLSQMPLRPLVFS